jgi:hypothetical protein
MRCELTRTGKQPDSNFGTVPSIGVDHDFPEILCSEGLLFQDQLQDSLKINGSGEQKPL